MKNSIGKTVVRIILVSLYAILVMRLVGFVMPDTIEYASETPIEIFLFFYLLIFNLNTEGNLFFDRYLDKKYPWFYFPRKRIFIQLGIIILWTLISIGLPFVAWYYINDQSFIFDKAPVIVFIASIVFLLGFIGVSIAKNFFTEWNVSLLRAEHYKQEKLKADYRVLQNQVNPHFLFNSLNVLISEIKHNPTNAEDFTRKLSKVYRYVLQSKNHDLISLKKELEFIDSFIFLHKVRIGDALEYVVNISDEIVQMQIPPLTLQILIENAIKHNIANEENVLKISIESGSDNKLIVSNNLQIIDTVDSTYTGLSNLSKRFELLKKDGFTYGKQEEKFVVTIPLIEE
ncbi:histidine kinase [Ulvibacter sp. MAR_2010_11]|uniref:sensor histidine kinase n=1 Tax=Ulvibacter sp. MAR_2010_11 TaxID=1250229 RepID=UPI000C2B6148|nr:histidine kinase [Ulvibacter sp. MAR_2010_11]PKA84183.1 histidine kinase [Ulvibacter sp. MAR_2010_11]